MPEILKSLRLRGLRCDSLGRYLAALGLMQACSRKWGDFRGLWSDNEFVVGSTDLTSEALEEFLLRDWQPTSYERWWKGDTKEISKLRSWEPSLARLRLLDAHIVAKGTNVYNDILGTGGNVGKRDFAKVFEACRELVRKPQSPGWLSQTLYGTVACSALQTELPDLPSTGTWFAAANKAFNSGYSVAREGQLSPWSYLLALEGALLLRGGAGKRLSARATRYATFPFVSESAAPETVGELGSERSEFWAPIWDRPATIVELKALLQRGQARVGRRAARAPFDFAAAALSSGTQAGLVGFERFSLRQTTSANTYEGISTGRAWVSDDNPLGEIAVRIANWVDSLPRDKDSTQQSVFYGLRSPIERALLRLAEGGKPERWRELLLAIGQTQRRVDQNRNWRKSIAISKLPADLFKAAWPDSIAPEVEIARAIASLGPAEYGLRHNVFGFNRVRSPFRERFADPRPPSSIWHDGAPLGLLADVLERRLVDAEGLVRAGAGAPAPPLHGRQFCSPAVLDRFARGEVDMGIVTALIPAFSLLRWRRANWGETPREIAAPSAEFLLQGYFRPLLLSRSIEIAEGARIVPDATRARALVKMIRGAMWQQAAGVAERAYRSCGVDVIRPREDLAVSGDQIAACLLIPVETAVTRTTFRRWTIQTEKVKR